MKKSNYVIYDCETGGLESVENPITQFACVVLDFKTLKQIDEWETYVKPYNDLKITKKALDSSLISMSDVNRGMEIKDFVDTFSMFMSSHNTSSKDPYWGRPIGVGHNVYFDNGFIDYALRLYKKTIEEFFFSYIDTMSMSKQTWGVTGEESLRLSHCCEYANLKLTDAHGAMNDAKATADLFRFFTKKLRAKAGAVNESKTQRLIGNDFFEFKCAKMKTE